MCKPIRVAIPGFSPTARCDTDDSLEKSDLEWKLLCTWDEKHSGTGTCVEVFCAKKRLKKIPENFNKYKKAKPPRRQQKDLEADIREGRRKKVSKDKSLMFTSDCWKTESFCSPAALLPRSLRKTPNRFRPVSQQRLKDVTYLFTGRPSPSLPDCDGPPNSAFWGYQATPRKPAGELPASQPASQSVSRWPR